MKRTLTIELEVDSEVSDEDVEYAVDKVFNQIEQFDGFQNAHIINIMSANADDAQALHELLDQIEADGELAEKLEKAQEMAWRMAKSDDFMEVDEDE